MQNILVSIIIPIYKVEPYIVRCIESVLHQTYRNLEVILVDDCTPDHSMELAKDCIEQSPLSKDLSFVYLKHDHNRGLSAARNTGIDAATGEYVYFLDSDDEITKECIISLIQPLHHLKYDFIMGDYETKGANVLFPKQQVKGRVSGKDISLSYGCNLWHCMAWNKLCNLLFLKTNGLLFKEGLIHEDELWSAQLACVAKNMYFVEKQTYLYYMREQSIMTSEDNSNKLRCLKEVLRCFYEYQNSAYAYSPEIDSIENRLRNNVISLMLRLNYSAYRQYASLRSCNVCSWRLLNKRYKSVMLKIKHADEYLPIRIGFVYKKSLLPILFALKRYIIRIH